MLLIFFFVLAFTLSIGVIYEVLDFEDCLILLDLCFLQLAQVSGWMYIFLVFRYLESYKIVLPNITQMFGEIYLYFRFPGSSLIDFGFNETRQPSNILYTNKDTNKEYLKFFFFEFIPPYLKHWRNLKSTAFVFDYIFKLSVGLLVLWHFVLLRYLPWSSALNLVYLFVIFVNKLINLCCHTGALIIFNPLAFHKYEINIYFLSYQSKLLPKIFPLLFMLLILILFIILACASIMAYAGRMHNGVLIFFI